MTEPWEEYEVAKAVDALVEPLWRFYTACVAKGFTEEQAFILLDSHMEMLMDLNVGEDEV